MILEVGYKVLSYEKECKCHEDAHYLHWSWIG